MCDNRHTNKLMKVQNNLDNFTMFWHLDNYERRTQGITKLMESHLNQFASRCLKGFKAAHQMVWVVSQNPIHLPTRPNCNALRSFCRQTVNDEVKFPAIKHKYLTDLSYSAFNGEKLLMISRRDLNVHNFWGRLMSWYHDTHIVSWYTYWASV